MHKRKQVYREGYKSPGAKIAAAFLPKLPHIADGCEAKEAYIREAGRYDDGMEFQVLLIVVDPNVALPVHPEGR